MASNKYTTQTPKADNSVKVVLAQRVYIAPADTVYAAPTAKLDGTDPAAPWVDLGIVEGSKVNLTYSKETNYIETGIEKIRRGAYITGKTAQMTFDLSQFDAGVLEEISGLTSDVVNDAMSQAIGKAFHIGQEDLVQKALLVVGTNKIDGKEHQYYCKNGALTWSIEEADDARILRCVADLFAFTPSGESVDAFMTVYILD